MKQIRMVFMMMMMLLLLSVHLLYIQSIRLVKREERGEERGWRVYDDGVTMNEEWR